jgi:hypothetical protein
MKIRSGKLVVLAFAAALALSAVAAGSASASELIKFSKTGAFEGKSTATVILEFSGGSKFECRSLVIKKGEVTRETKGQALVLFDGCEITVFGEGACTTTGSEPGSIEIPVMLILLGGDENPTTKMNPAVLLKPEEAEKFTCTIANERAEFSMTGSLICLVKDTSDKEEINLDCEKGAKDGEQKDKLFWDSTQTGTENVLRTTVTGAIKFENEETDLQGSATLTSTGGSIIQVEE